MNIIFATQNEHKVKEIKNLLGNQVEIISLSDIGLKEDIPETASTIEGNSLLKAQFVWDKYRISCFADDTGLEIDSLNGEPGVYSARYAGIPKNDDANIHKVLLNLNNSNERKARFKTVITLVMSGDIYKFTGIVDGVIGNTKKGVNGFGYDPIFYPENNLKTFAEMTLEEKNKYSHRARAFEQLKDFLHLKQ
jgi:XTP/dITP diphosphohydrolase